MIPEGNPKMFDFIDARGPACATVGLAAGLCSEVEDRQACISETGLVGIVGSSSQADYLMRNAAMDDSIGGS